MVKKLLLTCNIFSRFYISMEWLVLLLAHIVPEMAQHKATQMELAGWTIYTTI